MNKQTILITGASTGIGKETAKYFHAKGWNVIATMRKPDAEEELTQLDNVLVTQLDVTDLHSIDAAVKLAINTFGKIDAVLNNAGYGAFGTLESFPRENIIKQYNTNVIGLIDVCKAIIPHFRKNMSGTIINVSSVGGQMTFPLGTLYHGTKFAVEGISEALHFEMKEINVNVKIIQPGAITTDFATRSLDFQHNEDYAEYQPIVDRLLSVMSEISQTTASPASLVAETIYEAATDNSDQLRYIVGEDAKLYIENRKKHGDEAFIAGLKEQFGI
ncbi:MAG: SDR family oxidoreductase [Hyphomicrobiales bacterium]